MSGQTSLASLGDVKEWLSIKDTNSDVILERLIIGCSEYFENFLNRKIILASYVEKYNGNGRERFRTREYPIVSITSLKIGGALVPTSPDGFKGGYVFDDKFIYLLDGSAISVFTEGVRNIEIAYSAGYAPTAIPEDIKQSIIEIVSLRFRSRSRIGLTSEGIAGQATAFTQKDMTDDVRMVMNNYRRVVA